MGNQELITAEGLAELERRLEDLRGQLAEVRMNKGKAALDGNVWHDNFAFEEAERQERALMQLIARVQGRIAGAMLVEPVGNTQHVDLGSVVDVELADGRELTVEIVDGPNANIREGRISYRAPLAQAIRGAIEGEERSYSVDGRSFSVRVLRVKSEAP